MLTKSAYATCLIILFMTATSCGIGHSKSDVVRYLGKTENEIVDILGAPTGWCGGPAEGSDLAGASPRRVLYRAETVNLPEPMTGLDFVLSNDGLCREVAGYTKGFSSPEDLLKEIGIQGKSLVRADEDDTRIRYEAPETKSVLVYKPSRIADRYTDFLVIG